MELMSKHFSQLTRDELFEIYKLRSPASNPASWAGSPSMTPISLGES